MYDLFYLLLICLILWIHLVQYDARTWFTWGNEIFQSFRASVWRTRWSTSICFNMFLPWSPSLCIFARRLWASLPQSREDKSPVSTFQLWGHYWASLAYFWAASGGDKDGGRVEEGVRKRLCYYLYFFWARTKMEDGWKGIFRKHLFRPIHFNALLSAQQRNAQLNWLSSMPRTI